MTTTIGSLSYSQIIITLQVCTVYININKYINKQGTAVAQWLRCCAKNRNVAGSIPAGVIGIFH